VGYRMVINYKAYWKLVNVSRAAQDPDFKKLWRLKAEQLLKNYLRKG
jgi:hypothetical protein